MTQNGGELTPRLTSPQRLSDSGPPTLPFALADNPADIRHKIHSKTLCLICAQ
jgi:hypothetical protein